MLASVIRFIRAWKRYNQSLAEVRQMMTDEGLIPG